MNFDKPTKLAISATAHCLVGCGIGEVLGMVITNAPHRKAGSSIFVSILLAFIIGYSLSLRPLLKNGVGLKRSMKLAFASDTISITSMEVTDNLILLLIPSALAAPVNSVLFWLSLGLSLCIAFLVTVPVNRWLIARGKGHAAVHQYMH